MIYTLHTKDDLIYAYASFITVDIDGKPKNEGLYIYVENVWVHNSYRDGKTLMKLVKGIDKHPECKNAKFVYWRRDKYDRISRPYLRERFNKELIHHA